MENHQDAKTFVMVSGNVMSAVDVVFYGDDGRENVVARYSLNRRDEAHSRAKQDTRYTNYEHKVLWWDGTPWWMPEDVVADFERNHMAPDREETSDEIATYEQEWKDLVVKHGGVEVER